MASLQWGALCGVAAVLIAMIVFATDALQGQRAGQLDTWFGIVRRSQRPALFRYALAGRWAGVVTFGIGAVVMARFFDLIGR